MACPTLLATVGLMNLNKELTSKKTRIVFTLFVFVYGFIGVVKFHVYLDIPLLILGLLSVWNLRQPKELS